MCRTNSVTLIAHIRQRRRIPEAYVRVTTHGYCVSACPVRLSTALIVGLVLGAFSVCVAQTSAAPANTNVAATSSDRAEVHTTTALMMGERSEPPPRIALPLIQKPLAQPVRLGPVDVEALLQEDRDNPDMRKRLRIGIGRTLEVGPDDGQWTTLPDGGHLWRLAVVSEGAVGVRVHVSDCALPVGGELRVFSVLPPRRSQSHFTGTGPFGTGAFWSTIFPGDMLYVEYRTPSTTDGVPGSVPFVINELQHLYRDPVRGSRKCDCHNDATCYEEWNNVSNSVARVAYVNGDSLVCTGELINCLLNDLTPYFLTAGHCIDSEEVAQSMVFYWKYRTETCDGPPPDIETVPTCSVGQYLTSSWWPHWYEDFALVMIRGELPSGPYSWGGWTTNTVANGTECTCVHHPDGGHQRISFANKTYGAPYGFIRMDWYDGPAESGSSGSGTHLDSTGQLAGVLSYGASSCEDESWDDFYSFSEIYWYASDYFAGGSDDAFEENDSCAEAVAISPGTYADLVLKYKYVYPKHYRDSDWYRIKSSNCGPVDILLEFTDAFGNIDMELYDACGGSVVASSKGIGDSETISIAPEPSREYWLKVRLASNARNTYNLTINAPDTGTMTFSAEAGISIPDNNLDGIEHSIWIPSHINLEGLKAAVRIDHTFNGDLEVTLTHETTTVTLIDRPGVPKSPVGFNNDGFDVMLDTIAASRIEDHDSGGPKVVGTFQPEESLGTFNGQDAFGQWTLRVADHEPGDTGTLISWALHIPPQEPCDCGGDGDFNGDANTDFADFAAFQRCFTGSDVGPPPIGCQLFNFDCDWDVDLDDFAEFMNWFGAPQGRSTGQNPNAPGALHPNL